MTNSTSDSFVEKKISKLRLNEVKKHILLCTGNSCCSQEEGTDAWQFLKSRLTELGLSPGMCYRSKVGCLRICQGGPIALLYPAGRWYKDANRDNLERIIQMDIIDGEPVEDILIAAQSLPPQPID